MAKDIELVIKIPEEDWNFVKESDGCRWSKAIIDGVINAKQLPKGHGRLSDMDELVKNIVKEYGVNSIHELPQDIKMFYDKFIKSAPTILDATVEYKLKNYAFSRKKEEEK